MFLSLPSTEKGRSLTGFSLSHCFSHKSFHWRNKFLPNASKQPQTQQPRLQSHRGTLPHSGTFGCCLLTRWWGKEYLFPLFTWELQSHHCYLQADEARHDEGMYFGVFSTCSGCLRHCSYVVHLPTTASISS